MNEIELFKKRFNDTIYENGIDADKISKATGIHISTIYRYINGDIKDLKMSNIFKLATFLNVSPIWLEGWCDDKDISKKIEDNVSFIIVLYHILRKISKNSPNINEKLAYEDAF